jgi:rubrerythrin
MIDDIHLFLVHAIQLERDAARQYEDLAQVMGSAGNREVQALFERMALFSRRHLKEAMQRGGFRELPVLAPDEFQWPGGASPEAASWQGVDGLIDVTAALDLALAGEKAGYDFYADVARHSNDPEVGRMAREFASEESAHVRDLQAWIVRLAA